MGAYYDAVIADSPVAYWRLGESSGTIAADSSGNGYNGTYRNAPTLGVDPLGFHKSDTAVSFNGTNQYVNISTTPFPAFEFLRKLTSGWTVEAWIKRNTQNRYDWILDHSSNLSGSNNFGFYVSNGNKLTCFARDLSTGAFNAIGSTNLLAGKTYHVVGVYDDVANKIKVYVNGVEDGSVNVSSDFVGDGVTVGGTEIGTYTGYLPFSFNGTLDEVAIYDRVLTDTEIADHYAISEFVPAIAVPTPLQKPALLAQSFVAWLAAGTPLQLPVLGPLPQRITLAAGTMLQPPALRTTSVTAAAQTLPLALTDQTVTAAQPVPLTLQGSLVTAQQSVPLALRSIVEADFLATSITWAPVVKLGGVDISTDLVGFVRLEQEEDASGLCSLLYIPPVGELDLEDYEQQTLTVDVQTSAWTFRRFTGVVDVADYDPVTGLVRIRATTNLQGRLEALDRATIDAAIGGQWSPIIFDDRATGFGYATARLSTVPAEMHIDPSGALRVVPWAAKATPDITITDSARFNDSLRLSRATRRDLLSQITLVIQYRYPLLRHREYRMTYTGHTMCQLAGYQQPTVASALTREILQSAVDRTKWAMYDLTYTALPSSGAYSCSGIAGAFTWTNRSRSSTPMLGATWRIARRWAQDVTEQYTLTVAAPDLAAKIGTKDRTERYGLQAAWDTSGWEASTISGTPAGASRVSALAGDYILPTTTRASDGRSAATTAIQAALAKARREILSRARRTSVSASIVYRPDLTLAHTVKLQATGLIAQGKVRRIEEQMDTERGGLSMTIELAISRRLGTVEAEDSTLTAPAAPTPTSAAGEDRLILPLRIGGQATSPPDDLSWDGWMTNVRGDAAGPVYQTRCVLKLPAVPADDRDAKTLPVMQSYNVAIPNDLLTLTR